MADIRPIGLFDSGIGGLSVWREVIRQLPDEATVYVADRAYCPYGNRSIEEIRARSLAMGRFLLEQNCKLLVVACNTASAAALAHLRTQFSLPIVGMEPAIKPAARASQTGSVGLLATAGTIQGSLFQNTSRRYANNIQVHVQVGQGLVEQVEAGHLTGPQTETLLHRYLDPLLAAGADQIVLGCTHYPLLMPLIKEIVGPQAEVIDPARAVAHQVMRLLSAYNLATTTAQMPDHTFYTTGRPASFKLPAQTPGQSERPIFFETVRV
jgi:glutamate racemase